MLFKKILSLRHLPNPPARNSEDGQPINIKKQMEIQDVWRFQSSQLVAFGSQKTYYGEQKAIIDSKFPLVLGNHEEYRVLSNIKSQSKQYDCTSKPVEDNRSLVLRPCYLLAEKIFEAHKISKLLSSSSDHPEGEASSSIEPTMRWRSASINLQP